jgi:FkbM family methyltransferase
MRLIDCGAFNGDTIQGLLEEGYTIDAALALEPDPDNFNQLANALPDINVINIPCGAAKDLAQFYFDDGMGMGSKMDPSGSKLIQCVSLSKLAPRFSPTLIKMDIEGAEVEALEGAKELIRSYTPGLAIAIYHEPDHIWKIPLMIQEWDLGYELYIRTHERNSFGTILYASRNG